MAPHANPKSLSAAALSSLLERRAAAANAVPSKLARRRGRNLRRRGKDRKDDADEGSDINPDHSTDPKGEYPKDGDGESMNRSRTSSSAVVVLHGEQGKS